MEIILRESKSLLNRSGSSFFTLNPYVGCEHACRYCYATYISRWRHRDTPWGTWVEVKINASKILEREIRRFREGTVFISTVCDAYQPVEETFQISRQCISILADSPLNLFLLTKSERVLRDTDVLSKSPRFQVAFSLALLDDEIARLFEPKASLPSLRLKTAKELKNRGIRTGILINPILPYFTENLLPQMVKEIEEANLDFISFDSLHYIDSYVGGRIRPIYERFGSSAVERLEYAKSPFYIDELKEEIKRIMAGSRISWDLAF